MALCCRYLELVSSDFGVHRPGGAFHTPTPLETQFNNEALNGDTRQRYNLMSQIIPIKPLWTLDLDHGAMIVAAAQVVGASRRLKVLSLQDGMFGEEITQWDSDSFDDCAFSRDGQLHWTVSALSDDVDL